MTTRIVFPIAAAAVFAVSLALRVVYLDERSLWFDEASSWLTSQFPLHRLMDSLKQSTHVPLYYPLLRIWMAIFGDSPTAIRSLSVVLGLLTACACGLLGGKLASTLAKENSPLEQQHHCSVCFVPPSVVSMRFRCWRPLKLACIHWGLCCRLFLRWQR